MRKIIERKKYSPHPGDHYLSVVLCEWNGEYVTWMHNKEDNGYFWGHYFSDLEKARIDYRKRGRIW